jgi:hypothetical protein
LDEFFLWQPYAERYGYTIFALQWWFGGGEAVEDYYAPQQMYPLIRAPLQTPPLRAGIKRSRGSRGSEFLLYEAPAFRPGRFTEDVLDQHGIRPGTALLHGFSRGSANVYALTALDQQTGHHFFQLTVANAGAAAEDFPPNRDITKGVFGQAVFLGTHWVLFCGGYDEHPDRDGCPAMRRTQAWLARLGGMVEDLIEDDAAGHGGFHQHQANVTRALDVFDRLLGSSGSSSARQVQ